MKKPPQTKKEYEWSGDTPAIIISRLAEQILNVL